MATTIVLQTSNSDVPLHKLHVHQIAAIPWKKHSNFNIDFCFESRIQCLSIKIHGELLVLVTSYAESLQFKYEVENGVVNSFGVVGKGIDDRNSNSF